MDFVQKRYLARSAENIGYKGFASDKENSLSSIFSGDERSWTLPSEWTTRFTYNNYEDSPGVTVCYHDENLKPSLSGKLYYQTKKSSNSDYRSKRDSKSQEGYQISKPFEQNNKTPFHSRSARKLRDSSLSKNKTDNKPLICSHCSRQPTGSHQTKTYYSSSQRSSGAKSKDSMTNYSSVVGKSRDNFSTLYPISIDSKQSPFMYHNRTSRSTSANARSKIETTQHSYPSLGRATSPSHSNKSYQPVSQRNTEGCTTYTRSSFPEFKPTSCYYTSTNSLDSRAPLSKVEAMPNFYRTPSRISKFIYNPSSSLNSNSQRRMYSSPEPTKLELTHKSSGISIPKYQGRFDTYMSEGKETTEILDRGRHKSFPMHSLDSSFMTANQPLMRLSERPGYVTHRSRSPSCR